MRLVARPSRVLARWEAKNQALNLYLFRPLLKP